MAPTANELLIQATPGYTQDTLVIVIASGIGTGSLERGVRRGITIRITIRMENLGLPWAEGEGIYRGTDPGLQAV
jgi:hypothetical protein